MENPEYTVVDTETTIKGTKLNKASAFWKDNRTVYIGHKEHEHTEGHVVKVNSRTNVELRKALLVGHNIKFDLHHLRKITVAPEQHVECVLWDTQLAEYLLSGQQHTYAKLNDLAAKYGGTLKDEKVSEMFAAGIGADAIDESIITPYLASDVENTELVFLAQFEQAIAEGMLPLIFSQMDALLATSEMTWNGMAIDRKFLYTETLALSTRLTILKDEIDKAISHITTVPIEQININSNQQIGALLFGGTLKYVVEEEIGEYKSGIKKGMKKTKKVTVSVTQPPIFAAKPHMFTEKGSYKVDNAVLTELGRTAELPTVSGGTAMVVSKLLGLLLKYNDSEKQLTTYFQGVADAIYDDGFIHQELNHCVTATGRLSSSKPNMQNMTNGLIKKAFISRWGEKGNIVEIDYGQLEIIGLACVSGDMQLIKDISEGTDIHTALYVDMYGRKPSKEERKAFKPLTFGLTYGAGKNTLATNAGCSVGVAEKFIKTFYTRYPGVKSWHDTYASMVKGLRKPSHFRDERGMPVGASVIQDHWTNRKYVFKEYPSPDFMKAKGVTHSFSPTEMKNYPIQGFATGDIVPMMLGEVYRELVANPVLKNKCLMINTVHDSLLFDVQDEVLEEAIDFLKGVLENTPMYFAKRFGITLPFSKFQVGVSVGKNWFDQTERK